MDDLGGLVSGRDAEFCDFVAARSRALLRTAYLLTGDHHHAEDLVQTALVKVYQSWSRIHAAHAVEAYARKTLVNTYVSWWRRKSWGEHPVDGDTAAALGGGHTATDEIGAVDERSVMWHRLRGLPRQQRAVVVLRYYEDLSIEETARLLGMSTGTVKSHTSRALKALRIQLSDESLSSAMSSNNPDGRRVVAPMVSSRTPSMRAELP